MTTKSGEFSEIWYPSAGQALERRDFRQAHMLCLQRLQSVGPDADAFFLLGAIAAEHNNFAGALEMANRALAVDGQDPRLHAQKARALLSLQRRDEARLAADTGLALGPRDALTWDTLGVVYTRLGDHAASTALFEAAVAAYPKNASFLYNLGASRQFAGRFDAAADAYREAIVLQPDLYKAYSALVQLRRQSAEDNLIAPMQALFDAAGEDAEQRLHLGHALAKSFEDMGELEVALDWLGRAKSARRAALGYRFEVDAPVFAAAREAISPVGRGNRDDRPIFIVGLPRTGTTLVDRILSSHSAVVSAGELSNFAMLVKQTAKTPGNLVLDGPTLRAGAGLDLGDIGRRYVESTRALIGDAARFIDKMPLNVFFAGLIHAALPDARIICLRRHPMDACLSNYRQLFATSFSYYNYALDLDDCARYVLAFEALAADWRATLPADRYTEVAYEDIVADLEGSARRLVAHCGLAWEPACLEFHTQTSPVATASSVQVRQPLYASSVDRWRRYGPALDGLRQRLTEGGVLDAEGGWLRG